MLIGKVCQRNVVVIESERTVQEAAALMRSEHVGDLIVIENHGQAKPIGIVTDRDIVMGVVAPDLDPRVLTVGDIMGPRIETMSEEQDIFEAIHRMRRKGIRRIPVVNSAGLLIGIVTTDDVLNLLADEFKELAQVISREHANEARTRK